HSGRTKRAALSMTTLRFWSSGISLLLCVLRKRTAPIMAKLREQQARDPWLLLLLWLLLRLGLRLRHARWRAERVTAGRTETAGTECSLSDRLADSRLLPLRIQSLLRIRCRFLERIPDELPLDILLPVVVDLLRRR